MVERRRERARLDKAERGTVAERAMASFIIPHLWVLKVAEGLDNSKESRFGARSAWGLFVFGALVGLAIGVIANGEDGRLPGAIIGASVSVALSIAFAIKQGVDDASAARYHDAFCSYWNRREAELARARTAGEISPERATKKFMAAICGRSTPEEAHMRDWSLRSNVHPPTKPASMRGHECFAIGCFTTDPL